MGVAILMNVPVGICFLITFVCEYQSHLLRVKINVHLLVYAKVGKIE